MTAAEVKERLSEPGFQFLGERNGLDYYSMCHIETRRWLYGPLYSVDWEEETITEHNASEHDFRTQPRRKFFEHSRHRTFIEITQEGFTQFFSLFRGSYEDMIESVLKLPGLDIDTIHTVNTYGKAEAK